MRDMLVQNHPTAHTVSDLSTGEVSRMLNLFKTFGSETTSADAVPLEDVILRLEIELVRRSMNL